MSVPDDPFNSTLPAPRPIQQTPRDRSPSGSSGPGTSFNPTSIHTPTYGLNVPSGTANSGAQGTAGTVAGGAKTPRRVQWNSHIVNVPSVPKPVADLTAAEEADRHSLNEQGLGYLTTELERHQSLSRAERDRPRFMIGGDDRDEDEEISLGGGGDGEEDYDYRLDTTDGEGRGSRRRYGGGDRASSIHSSGASSVISEGDTEYDRNSPPRQSDRAGEMGDLEKTLTNTEADADNEKIDVKTAGGLVHPSAALAPPEALIPEENVRMEPDIRDEMAVFVDPGETDGLPSLPPGHNSTPAGADSYNETEQLNAQASMLVRAHKSGRFGNFLRNRKTGLQKGIGQGVTGVTGVATGVATGVGRGAMGVANGVAGTVTGRKRQGSGGQPSMGLAGMAMGGRPGGTGAGALAGGGVLASLLALYDNGQNGQSGQSTPASSRPPSLMPSDDSSDSEAERERERKWMKKREKENTLRREKETRRLKREQEARNRKSFLESMPSRVRSPLHSNVGSELQRQQQGRKHAVSDPPAPEGDFAMSADDGRLGVPNAPFAAEHRSQSSGSLADSGRRSPGFFRTVKKAADRLGLDADDHERPKQARNGAGVFGALVQNAGALTGPATPSGATLVPNAKRHGYRLNRYSLHEDKETLQPSRPSSLYERSQTPQSTTRVGTDESPTSQTHMVEQVNNLVRPATTDNRGRPNAIELPPRHRSGKPFSIKSFTDLTSLPLTPGSHFKNFISGKGSQPGTPPSEYGERQTDYFGEKESKWQLEDDRKREKWEAEKKKRKRAKEKKKQQEIFIIQHVAAILARQQFLMKLIRAFMM